MITNKLTAHGLSVNTTAWFLLLAIGQHCIFCRGVNGKANQVSWIGKQGANMESKQLFAGEGRGFPNAPIPKLRRLVRAKNQSQDTEQAHRNDYQQ